MKYDFIYVYSFSFGMSTFFVVSMLGFFALCLHWCNSELRRVNTSGKFLLICSFFGFICGFLMYCLLLSIICYLQVCVLCKNKRHYLLCSFAFGLKL